MVVTVLKVLDKKLKSRRFSTEVMENFYYFISLHVILCRAA